MIFEEKKRRSNFVEQDIDQNKQGGKRTLLRQNNTLYKFSIKLSFSSIGQTTFFYVISIIVESAVTI